MKVPYRFRRLDNNQEVVLRMTFAERLERVNVLGRITLADGCEAQLVVDLPRRACQKRKKACPWSKPHSSWALACSTQDAKQREAYLKQCGVQGVSHREVKPGMCVMETHSRGARRNAMKALGYFDKDAGYGDANHG